MSDLVTWLREQFDEDERVAQKASRTDVRQWAHYLLWARFSRARVLAEVAAKRRVLDLRDSWARQAEVAPAEVAHVFEAQVSAADAIIRALAQPCADRPGFREEWRR